MDIQKGDGIITHDGQQGIVIGDVFETNGDAPYLAVPVHFEEWEGPIQLAAIVEVWRDGFRVDNVVQLTLWE